MKGACLCGAITIQANTNGQVEVCHCSMCRRWGGGPLLAIHCGTEVTIEGSDHIQAFDSSEWGQRGFCKQCGTHLFYKLKSTGEYIMSAGLFQEETAFALKEQIFIDKKPSYYEFANQTPTMTEAEVFQKFASG